MRIPARLAGAALALFVLFAPVHALAADFMPHVYSDTTTATTSSQEVAFDFSAFDITAYNKGSVSVFMSIHSATATTSSPSIEIPAGMTLKVRRVVWSENEWRGITSVGVITASSTADIIITATRPEE